MCWPTTNMQVDSKVMVIFKFVLEVRRSAYSIPSCLMTHLIFQCTFFPMYLCLRVVPFSVTVYFRHINDVWGFVGFVLVSKFLYLCMHWRVFDNFQQKKKSCRGMLETSWCVKKKLSGVVVLEIWRWYIGVGGSIFLLLTSYCWEDGLGKTLGIVEAC